MTRPPRVLFVCTHNAGRSALGGALARSEFGDALVVETAGVEPQSSPSPVTVDSLAEVGIDDAQHVPSKLTAEAVARADVVVAMKPGLPIPQVDGVRYETWSLPDPNGWDIDGVRPLRDEIRRRVLELGRPLVHGVEPA